MKIRITAEIPTAPELKPEIGSIHEVVDRELMPNGLRFFMIRAGMTKIAIAESECEVVRQENSPAVVTPHQSRE